VVGKLFRSESTQANKKNLMIFVTPTIIDPAGNRLHPEGSMPFEQQAAISVGLGK
jgi:type II secretory pathway component GspD/PulD (secretin)